MAAVVDRHSAQKLLAVGELIMKYRKWTSAEKNLIARLRKQKASVRFIAERLNATENQIRGILCKSGVTKKIHRWTVKDDARLLEMTSHNASAREIGKALGRTRDSVNQRRYNLRKRAKKEPDA